ncbi:hypothetical protein [Actinoplanes sp. NPDC026670]|uniref:hypothetical protein n=1 Tax=Actinoplanes sp. NPDC026670 TaxID=3154700 RepID=UPI0033FC0D4F
MLLRWLPVAAVAVAGVAAAAVALSRRPVVDDEAAPPSSPPPSPEPPAGRPDPPRFRAILLAIAAGVLGVWALAIHTNASREPVCAEAGRRVPELKVDAYRYSTSDDIGGENTLRSTVYANLDTCLSRR